jgi:hypothetical protein
MKGEFSRLTFDPRNHFTGTLWQQGRVGSDADWNEWVEQVLHRRKLETVDVIGGCGRPIHHPGFTLKIVGKPAANPSIELSPGRLYAGGLLAELEQATNFLQQIDWPIPDSKVWTSLFPNDPDWPGLNFGTVSGGKTQKTLFYAEVWLRHVTAINDEAARDQAFSDYNGKPDWNLRPEVGDYVRERAFGGPDTCTRLQTVAQVKVWDATDEKVVDCPSACAKLAAARPSGTTGSLQVNVTPTPPVQKPCEEPLTGGYGGAENRTYRVEIHNPGPAGTATFKWSNENGAFTVRVNATALTNIKANTDLILQSIGNDQITQLHQNDWVEMCGEETELGMFRNDLVQLVSDPIALPDGTWKVQLTDAVVVPHAPFLRRWSAATQIIALVTPFDLDPGTGLSVSFFDAAGGGTGETYFHEMDYWVWAARTVTRDIEPPALMNTPQAAQGIKRHYCCLALVTWTLNSTAINWSVNSCPNLFPPLTEIPTGQDCGCCCTVTVGEKGQYNSIQQAIDSLPGSGGHVCILPGIYSENVEILNRHNIIISGCGQRTLLRGLPANPGETEALPVVSVIGGFNIRLERLSVEAADSGIGILLLGRNPFSKNQLQKAKSYLVNASITAVSVTAGLRDSLRARFVRELNVESCEFRNRDEPGIEHTVTLLVNGGRFERNLVEVAAKRSSTLVKDAAPVDAIAPIPFSPGTQAFGGIQLQGTSRSITLTGNIIRGGSGHGITLGSVRTATDLNDLGPGDKEPVNTAVDPSSVRDPFNIIVNFVPSDSSNQSRVISEGSLSNIRIERNYITLMGGCGVGVDRFFDLNGLDQFISVANLAIIGNEITQCLQRTIEEPSEGAAKFAGYGGISLADVENLVVLDNTVSKNGSQPGDPVCGFFALHVEGADLSRNRILDNGATSTESLTPTLKRGQRGGIVIMYALAPTEEIALPPLGNLPKTAPDQNGVPAARIHDNIVSTPVGQALFLNALGAVSVLNNQFTTRGVVPGGISTGFIASTVWIINLGFSDEFYLEYLLFATIGSEESQPLPGIDDATPGHVLANGQVLFANNQVVTDFLAVALGFSLAPILIITLDDLGFHDNQCEADLLIDFIISQAVLFGLSLRTTSNRFEEGIFNAVLSALTVGIFANTTALNQSTHCIVALGGNLTDVFNTAIVGANPLLSGGGKVTCESYREVLSTSLKQ